MPVRLVSQEEPLPGYRLLERLGRGGFGEVWKVEAPGGLLKAMKFVFGDLEAEDEESRPAEQELKALKRVREIRHPYILSLERYDIIEGQLMIVMELADRNLWDRFRECRNEGLAGIPREELLRYMEETAEALDLMNNHYQIQHLDIKPQNLFLVFNHIKVGDFGLAKMLEGVRATVTGGVTPVYAAPETFEGYISRFSDQYSLAIVFQELLTGVRPFTGSNTRQLLMQHLNGNPNLTSLSPTDKPIIAKSLNKKPTDRWASCTDMVRALRASNGSTSGPIAFPVAGSPPRPSPESGTESAFVTRLQVSGTDPNTGSERGEAAKSPRASPPVIPYPEKPELRSPLYPRPTPAGTPSPAYNIAPNGQQIPRLVIPTAQKSEEDLAQTLRRPQVFQTARMESLGIAPPEKVGDGALFPALVVAIGHVGRLVLEDLRRVVRDRFGNPEKVPSLRCLYLDTDPEVASLANGQVDGEGLTARELIHTRLNRPAHYLQRDTLPSVEQWLPQGSLYRLPRNPGSAEGVRAFGRLALFDHYRLVAQRVRQEIETFLTDDALLKANETTGLGLRTNRPRAYIVAGLGGGTGGGMFLDLAYLVRHELRAHGYAKPEVVGLFLVPPADRRASRNAALGNTYAALTELHYFQSRRAQYQTTFDRSEAPIVDSEAPFARTTILQLPRALDEKRREEITGRAARAIFNEMLSPAGRVMAEVRDVYRNAYPAESPSCQTFGLYRLTWPRPEVLTATTRRFAHKLLERWTSRDRNTLREPISRWLDSQWTERKLGLESMVAKFENAAENVLRDRPERMIESLLDSLATRTPSNSRLDAAAAASVVDEVVKIVGIPGSEQPGKLHQPLVARSEQVAKESESQLAHMAVTFIEQPLYRLAGAEEAVRQIGDRLKCEVEVVGRTYYSLAEETRAVWGRITALMNKGSGRRGTSIEVIDLLRQYARGRLRMLLLECSHSTYRKLVGASPEYLREIGMCRSSLMDMQNVIAGAPLPGGDSMGTGRLILPEGCSSLEDVADRFLAGISAEDVLAFDESIQRIAKRKFRGVAAICLKPAEKGPVFREMLLEKAREFLDEKLDSADPATVFYRTRAGTEADHGLIKDAFDQAAPEVVGLANTTPDELTILAVPTSVEGARFRSLVDEALPGVEFIPAPLPDDITFYREYPQLDLSDLPQMGDHAANAAQTMNGADHSPYSRTDINWTIPEEPPPA